MRGEAETGRLRAAYGRGSGWLAGRRRALAGACAAGSVALLVSTFGADAGAGAHAGAEAGAGAGADAGAGAGADAGAGGDEGGGREPSGGATTAYDRGVGARPAEDAAPDAGSGLVGVPVRMADSGAVALLRSGARIDVLAVRMEPPGEVRTVAAGLEVLAVPRADVIDEGALLVLAATPAQARELAEQSAVARLSFTIPAR